MGLQRVRKFMQKGLVLGAGTIGSLIAGLLAQTEDYAVPLADPDEAVVMRVAAELGRHNLSPCPGHCEKIQCLMKDLKLDKDRPTLKRIFESAIPKTMQDVVLISVSVSVKQRGELYEQN